MAGDVLPLSGSPFGTVPSKNAARLCNFATASDHLLIEHQKWISEMLNKTVRSLPNAWIEIIGYASKRGNAQYNHQLSMRRCQAVENFIKFIVDQVDSSLSGRITYIKGHPKGEELSDGKEENNDGYWRAVEVYVYGTKPPPRPQPPGPVPPKETSKDWSVKGYPGYMHGVGSMAQVGIAFYKFRNNKTNVEKLFCSLQFGGGLSLDSIFSWLKTLEEQGKISLAVLSKITGIIGKFLTKFPGITKISDLWTKVPGKFQELIKEIATALVTGSSVPFEYPWTKCEVHQPLTFERLNLQTIGGASGSTGKSTSGHTYVYGKVWYTEKSGKKMFSTRDLLDFDAGGSGYQFPGLGASGGPLIMI